MLIAWTWNQLAHECGTFVAAVVVVACLTYLTRRMAVLLPSRERKLRADGIATGLTRGARENPYRFTLLDLLVTITLVGASIGLVSGMARERDSGLPNKLHDEWGIGSP